MDRFAVTCDVPDVRSSTRLFRASDDTHLVRLAGKRAWLQERNVVFGVDLDGPTLGPSFALGDGEQLAEIEGNVAVVQSSKDALRGIDVDSGEESWRIEPDERSYSERRSSFSIRWWYESTENATRVRYLDLSSGQFGDPQLLEHESFRAPILFSWAGKDLLATGRGRDVHIVHADGREPERRRLPAAPGGDSRFIFPFAGTWYVQGRGEGSQGPFSRLVPLDAARPTLECEELAFPSIASGDRLVIASGDGSVFAYVWEPDDEQPTKRYLGQGRFGRAVAAGPHAAVLLDSTLHVQGSSGAWSTFETPVESLVDIEERDGMPTLIMSGGGLALCPIAEMAELAPGSHPHPVQTIPVPMPAPPAAEVTYVGKATGTGIAMHPQFGRLTFKASDHPDVAKGDQIEVLSRSGTSVGRWRPITAKSPSATPRDDLLAAPDPIGPPPEPAEPEPFESSRMLERWRARTDTDGVETPALLERVYEVFDRGSLERSALERLFTELDPEAALDDDVAELLAEDGEERHLVGFARDCEGNPIGFVAGESGVYKVDDGELWEPAESFTDWVEEQLDSLADDGATELVDRLRELLELPGSD